MRKGFQIYEKMRKYFPIYEEAVSRIWLCNWLHSEFPYKWGKFDFLFYQCTSPMHLGTRTQRTMLIIVVSGSGSGTLDKNGLLLTWFGWLTMNIPLPLEEATGLTIHAPAKQHRESKGCSGKVFFKLNHFWGWPIFIEFLLTVIQSTQSKPT